MRYFKAFLFNFLVVFFANYLFPGIEPMMAKLPHIGGDLVFALGLGLINSLIYPALKLLRQSTAIVRIAIFAVGINFLAYALAKFLPLGVHVESVEGYLFGSFLVSIGSVLLNYYEMKGQKISQSEEPKIHP